MIKNGNYVFMDLCYLLYEIDINWVVGVSKKSPLHFIILILIL